MQEGNTDIPFQFYKNLGYLSVGPNETVIKYGDIGDTFYIIIKGAVEVSNLIFSSRFIFQLLQMYD